MCVALCVIYIRMISLYMFLVHSSMLYACIISLRRGGFLLRTVFGLFASSKSHDETT